MPSANASWRNDEGMYWRHVRSNLFRSKVRLMSGCAVGICGECERSGLLVRVDLAGGLETRPDTLMTVSGLENW